MSPAATPLRAAVLALCMLAFTNATPVQLESMKSIESFNITTPITISGLSAGAFMAVQFHVAFSSLVSGAGILAGGPYWCAESLLGYAETRCMDLPNEINTQTLIDYTSYVAEKQLIDPTSNLAEDKVWVLSATDDTVIKKGVVEKLVDYYSHYLNEPTTQIATVYDEPGEHSFLTDGYGSKCTYLGTPYINDCSYDAAGALLQSIFNNELEDPSTTDDDGALMLGKIVTFDQTEYIDEGMGMYDTGYLYVPNQCADTGAHCQLHVAFHGCSQTVDDIDQQYVKATGYNRWAAANDMIILYPQAAKIYKGDANPKGCFDWWGYTDKSTYTTQKGPQMAAVYNMIQDML